MLRERDDDYPVEHARELVAVDAVEDQRLGVEPTLAYCVQFDPALGQLLARPVDAEEDAGHLLQPRAADLVGLAVDPAAGRSGSTRIATTCRA
ncbi:hypothetical protein [Frankia sp. Cas3]|uniref:hypothetical protein n=1 Tax=Frankia sp. Cas3 TaxID=3073926 RepID=UPI002AD55E3F|nr:hypothetical protein [Frankia sp. Cas3]